MFLEIIRVILFVVFGVSSLLLILVVCLQEGKGGGLAAAFGGAGGDTFGPGAGGVNKATSILAAAFVVAAVILGATQPDSVIEPTNPKPAAEETENGAAPAGDTGAKSEAPAEKSTDQPAKDGSGEGK